MIDNRNDTKHQGIAQESPPSLCFLTPRLKRMKIPDSNSIFQSRFAGNDQKKPKNLVEIDSKNLKNKEGRIKNFNQVYFWINN